MLGNTRHFSYYVNVGQIVAILGGLALGNRVIRLEEAKAGIEHRSIMEVIHDDVKKVGDWCDRTFGRKPKMYRHW